MGPGEPRSERNPDFSMNVVSASVSIPIFVPAQQSDGGSIWITLVPFIALIPFYYWMVIRPQQKERAKRQELLNSLKKNDRVVTTSGMIGTVANVSQDGKEITLKFGDATRIPFLRSAIEVVLKDTPEAAEPAART